MSTIATEGSGAESIAQSGTHIANTSTPVVVLSSARHGGLNVTQSLGRLGVEVFVVDANPRTLAFSSRYCRGKYVWDVDRSPAAASVDYLAGIGYKLRARPLLLPTTDTAALFVAGNHAALAESFLFPDLPFELAQSLHSKKSMHLLARSAGVPTPVAAFPVSTAEVLEFAEQARFPVILKPIDTRVRSGVRKMIVQRRADLLERYRMLEDPQHPNIMLQEFIPGGEDANWMFNGYFNADSECLFGITGKKLRQYRPYAGITSLGVCQPNETVAALTLHFMKTIGYRGVLDMGYRYDARDGQYKVFDINPRVGCTFRLFVSDNGMDVVRAEYLDLTGQPVAAGRAVPGRKWMVEDLDLASGFRYWRDGKVSPGEWLRSLRGIEEGAFLAKDDPGAAISMCTNDAREVCRRLFGLLTGRHRGPVSEK